MKPYFFNLLNSFSLIILGFWGYYNTLPAGPESLTVFIPVIFGIALLLCNVGIKKENKIISIILCSRTIHCQWIIMEI